MITYNPRHWFSLVFTFHKEDTFRRLLPMMIAISVYSFAVAGFEFLWWHLSDDKYVRNLSLLHNLLGFVLSLLLVFRVNSAYDRWWEGSVLWHQLMTVSRNFALKLNAVLGNEDTKNRDFFIEMIPLFAAQLRDYLRSSKNLLALNARDSSEGLSNTENKAGNKPADITGRIYERCYALQREKIINGEQLLSLYTDAEKLHDISGACERIKNTPIPSSYSLFLKRFVYLYIMTLPFGFVFSLGFYVVPVVAFIFYVLASLQIISEEIEDPFGHDVNDIPTDQIAQNVKEQVSKILTDEVYG